MPLDSRCESQDRLRGTTLSCICLRAERPNHVRSYNFMEDSIHDGRKYRVLNVVNKFTKEALTIRVNRRLNFKDVIDVITDLFILRGPPAYVRFDNGREFNAKAMRAWIEAVGAKTAYIAPGNPWENGYVEVFDTQIQNEMLDGEVFYSLTGAKIAIIGRYTTSMPYASIQRPDGVRPRQQPSSCCPAPPLCTTCQRRSGDGGRPTRYGWADAGCGSGCEQA